MDFVKKFVSLDQLHVLKNIAAVIGAGYVLKVFLRELWTLGGGFYTYFLAQRINLKKYGEWAVVTGASDGIGRGYALELARQGLNVVIMSRSREKLNKVAEEIREMYGREVMVIPVDFTRGQEVYPQIAEELKELDIGVLVNNVGKFQNNGPDYFLQVSAKNLRDTIEVNCQPMVQLTHMLLPKMLEKRRGIIVNLSSLGVITPLPLVAVYVSTKIFVNYFSDSLRHEYGSRGIIIQTVTPSLVITSMAAAMSMKVNIFQPNPETYSRSAVATIGIQNTTCGYWSHALQGRVFSFIPKWLFVHFGKKVMEQEIAKSRRAQLELDRP